MNYSIRNKNNPTNKYSSKRKILFAACATAVAIILFMGLELTNKINIFGDDQPTNQQETASMPDENSSEQPSTGAEDEQKEEEISSGNPKNESSQTNTPQSTNTTNTKKSVTPVITSADSTRVFGYISGVVESGGTCTFTFTGNGTVVKKVNGIENVSTTDCSTTPPSGNGWSVVLSYSSKTASGKSQMVSVN